MRTLFAFCMCLAVAKSDKIVGGQDAGGAIPYQAALQIYGSVICGGSVINSRWILSAAHCKAGLSTSGWRIALGMYDSSLALEPGRQIYGVKQAIQFEGYIANTMQGDLMVVELDGEASLSDSVQAVVLPEQYRETDQPVDGTNVTVSGWGTIRSNGLSPDKLRTVDVQVVAQSKCAQDYGLRYRIYPDMLCLAAPGKDSCQGDSGGPAVVQSLDNTQVGIVSWGIGCADPDYPGVYTRVSYYSDWINEKTT